MADKSVTVVPLMGTNFPTWKVQCQMALMKDGLWGIVNGTETLPGDATAERTSKFQVRKDRALALIVLSIDTSLLYLIGDPSDPIVVWTTLCNQFQKKTWANRLALRRKLHSIRLKEGQSIHEHVKAMTELFSELAVIGDVIKDDDRVIYLLASLPESFNALVTALEACDDVSKMDSVIEKLLHEEQKLIDRGHGCTSAKEPALMAKHRKKGPQCHFCKKFGHIKRNCREYEKTQMSSQDRRRR